MKFKQTCFEVKRLGEDKWQELPERIFLEKLVDYFDPVTPIITKMLKGNEVVAQTDIYRIRT